MDGISGYLGILIMMNNYFHDVATGLLISSSVALWVVMHKLEGTEGRETKEYFVKVYEGLTKLAKFSLAWILLGGVPRTLFYKRFEWNTAVEHGQIGAIIVKHVMVFVILCLGVYFWRKFGKRVKEIKEALEA